MAEARQIPVPVTRRGDGQTVAQGRWKASVILIGPGTLLLLAIFVYPFVYAIYLSFHEWTLGQQLTPVWAGLSNFVELMKSDRFLHSIIHSIQFVTGAVSIELVLGFALAILFNKHLPGLGFLRTLAVLPVMVMPVATGLAWFYILNFQYGPLNVILRSVHLPIQLWLTSPKSAMGAIILADVWQWTPFFIIVFVAGMRSLPEYVYEAAAIDGLRTFETFLKVTLPLMRPIILIALLLRFMDAFKLFDLVYMMTKGGPAGLTETLSYYIYVMGLQLFNLGLAAAASILFLIFINIVTQIFVRYLYRDEIREEVA